MTRTFFIPQASSAAQAESVYQSVKAFMSQVALKPHDRRILSVRYRHEGKTHTATVGVQDDWSKEIVVAIFEAEGPRGPIYMICTPSHGVAKSGPLMASDIEAVVDFAAT